MVQLSQTNVVDVPIQKLNELAQEISKKKNELFAEEKLIRAELDRRRLLKKQEAMSYISEHKDVLARFFELIEAPLVAKHIVDEDYWDSDIAIVASLDTN